MNIIDNSVKLYRGKYGRNRVVNKLVASAFIRMPTNMYSRVKHIDGNSFNNHVDNLEWMD